MFIGIVFALLACFVWSMIYIVPIFLEGYGALEITCMRYLFYGTFSSAIFFAKSRNIFKKYPLRMWVVAFMLALFGHVLYYFATVIALRLATPPVTVLIAGLVPIVVAFYGNWEMGETRFNSLILPAIAITVGIILVNFVEIDWTFKTESPGQYLFGLFAAFAALILWSWYAVKNGRFLKEYSHINHGDWATMLGIGTLFWIVIFLIFIFLGWNKSIEWSKYTSLSKNFFYFLCGTFFLGTICSWGGVFFWNKASAYLPLSVAGPLVIFETLFGLILVYIVNQKIPTFLELTGILSMLGGITYILIAVRNDSIES